MESSYRIIKNDYITSSKDGFVVDTNYEEVKETDYYEDEFDLEEEIDDEEKLQLLKDIDEYKAQVNMEIQADKKNIIEIARIEAQQEAMAIKEAAKREGYAEGYSQAIDEAKQEAAIIKHNAIDFLAKTKEYRDDYLKENVTNIYKLAKTMSENIINYSIDLEDENIIHLIKPLLVEYIKEEDIIITANGEGKLKLEKHRSKIQSICPNTRFIFLEDNSIAKNGFIVENDNQIADLQISVQLENMLKEISDQDE